MTPHLSELRFRTLEVKDSDSNPSVEVVHSAEIVVGYFTTFIKMSYYNSKPLISQIQFDPQIYSSFLKFIVYCYYYYHFSFSWLFANRETMGLQPVRFQSVWAVER